MGAGGSSVVDRVAGLPQLGIIGALAAVNRAEVDTTLLHPGSLGIGVTLDLADRSGYPASEHKSVGFGYIRGHLLD